MTLKIVPASVSDVNELVEAWHRHNAKLGGGAFFSVGLIDNDPSRYHEGYAAIKQDEQGFSLIGGAIVGPISARLLNHPKACELKRLVTDGTPNACSMLYAACWRAAKALGYETMYTYTLQSESGASLRASGWTADDKDVPARVWKSRAPEFAHLRWKDRPNACASDSFPRIRWVIGVRRPTTGGSLSDKTTDAEVPLPVAC